MKKIDKRVWWSLPIIVGVYLIFKQYSKKSTNTLILDATTDTTSGSTSNTSSTKTTYTSTYPLKLGSRDSGSPLSPKGLVVGLQKLINTRGYVPNSSSVLAYTKLAEDGIFGVKTQDAVKFWTGKTTMDDEFDLDNLKESLINKLPFTNVQTLF